MRISYVGIFVFAITSLFILSMPACQTLKNRAAEHKNEEELLNTQKTLAINYINQGLPNLALRELRPLVLQYPRDAEFKNLLGLTYLALKNPTMATNYFEESYKITPTAAIALNLSSAYIENKQYEKSKKTLKELRESTEGKEYTYPERIYHNLALTEERLKSPKMAETYYKLALRDNPFYYPSMMRLGQLYMRSHKVRLAEEQFQKAHEACIKCYDPLAALVSQNVLLGEYAKASTIIKEYLADKEIENTDRLKARKLLVELSNKNNSPIVSSREKVAPSPAQLD